MVTRFVGVATQGTKRIRAGGTLIQCLTTTRGAPPPPPNDPLMDVLWNETSNTTPLLRLVATRTNVDSYPYHTISHGPDLILPLIIASLLFSFKSLRAPSAER